MILVFALNPALDVTHHVPGVDWAGVNLSTAAGATGRRAGNPTGAGDAVAAGLVQGLVLGRPWEERWPGSG